MYNVLLSCSYVAEEKLAIAEKYLIPQVEELTGLSKSQITLTPEGLNVLIKSYCRESGVRSLRKQIEKIYRKVAFKVCSVDGINEDTNDMQQVVHDQESGLNISEENLTDYVGKPIFTSEKMYPDTPVRIYH